jgi:hypothetical protein
MRYSKFCLSDAFSAWDDFSSSMRMFTTSTENRRRNSSEKCIQNLNTSDDMYNISVPPAQLHNSRYYARFVYFHCRKLKQDHHLSGF